jgi:uncharacterized membrane protein required for colicin V production
LVDFLIILIGVISAYRGWKSGLLKSGLSLVGYIGGGLVGLVAGMKYLNNVHNIFGKFGLFILFIAIGSTVGEIIMATIGKVIHDKLMFAPIKFVDSILGATFEILKAAILIYLVFSLVIAANWQWPEKQISNSVIFDKAKSVVPGFIKSQTAKIKF